MADMLTVSAGESLRLWAFVLICLLVLGLLRSTLLRYAKDHEERTRKLLQEEPEGEAVGEVVQLPTRRPGMPVDE